MLNSNQLENVPLDLLNYNDFFCFPASRESVSLKAGIPGNGGKEG